MSTAFSVLSAAIDEAMADAESGDTKLQREHRTLEIATVPIYSPERIKSIRQREGVTQRTFASYFGVSCRTVKAWETGRNQPSGPSSRLLHLLENNKCSILG